MMELIGNWELEKKKLGKMRAQLWVDQQIGLSTSLANSDQIIKFAFIMYLTQWNFITNQCATQRKIWSKIVDKVDQEKQLMSSATLKMDMS